MTGLMARCETRHGGCSTGRARHVRCARGSSEHGACHRQPGSSPCPARNGVRWHRARPAATQDAMLLMQNATRRECRRMVVQGRGMKTRSAGAVDAARRSCSAVHHRHATARARPRGAVRTVRAGTQGRDGRGSPGDRGRGRLADIGDDLELAPTLLLKAETTELAEREWYEGRGGAQWFGSARLRGREDLTGGIEPATTKLPLDGDDSIVGRTAVLHDDKKGAPGKILACGAIEPAADEE